MKFVHMSKQVSGFLISIPSTYWTNVNVYISDSKDHDRADLCPDFSKYLYFLFAPTLIYRDNYPR
jgi:hypothetical protein